MKYMQICFYKSKSKEHEKTSFVKKLWKKYVTTVFTCFVAEMSTDLVHGINVDVINRF